LFDKGKPVEKQGRKAMGLQLCDKHSYDRQAAEDNAFGIRVLERLYQRGKT
jgi:hypothetical protein